jgi:broad specificity phosphatase PhoE
MRLILVRHGESVGNFENRLQGQAEYDLTDAGRRQAALTAERLARLGVDALYSSHLRRANETARIIGERLACSPVILPDLSEYHFGEASGATYAEIRERFPGVNPAERVFPGEEGRDAFHRRVTDALWGIADRHAGETAAVISHGGPIALFCQSVLGLPYLRPMPFSVANGSITLIEVADAPLGERDGRAALRHLNDVCHLRE